MATINDYDDLWCSWETVERHFDSWWGGRLMEIDPAFGYSYDLSDLKTTNVNTELLYDKIIISMEKSNAAFQKVEDHFKLTQHTPEEAQKMVCWCQAIKRCYFTLLGLCEADSKDSKDNAQLWDLRTELWRQRYKSLLLGVTKQR